MDELKKQVSRARQRLTLQRFKSCLIWSWFACLTIATMACLIPKIWPLELDRTMWMWSWMVGAASVGLVVATVWTLLTRDSQLEVAIELDRRFALKERVSSTLSLSDEELSTEAGQALLDDATRRVAQVEIAQQFRDQPQW